MFWLCWQTLDEATNLLGATCDTFIKTLEECIHIVNTSLNEVPVPVHTSIPPLPHNQSKSRVSISSPRISFISIVLYYLIKTFHFFSDREIKVLHTLSEVHQLTSEPRCHIARECGLEDALYNNYIVFFSFFSEKLEDTLN